MCHEAIIDLYERHARDYDEDRSRGLQERDWLDKFLRYVDSTEPILDLGCGVGEPIARYLIERGYRVLGVDSSPTMIEICRSRFPETEWLVGDMRRLRLRHRFAGVVAWDSFFHLHPDDQRRMFERIAAHVLPGAPLMFTSGASEGEAIGSYRGEPLYHGSLDSAEYEQLLGTNDFSIEDHVVDDPQCGMHTIWLARYKAGTRRTSNHSAGVTHE